MKKTALQAPHGAQLSLLSIPPPEPPKPSTRRPGPPLDHSRDFQKLIRSVSDRHNLWMVFSDFCEAAALAFANAIFRDDERETRYLKIAGSYSPEEFASFPRMLGIVTDALEDGARDFLGELFQQLELANHWHGQFFTPYEIARLCAELTIGGLGEIINARGFCTMQEPAAGSGVMVIAAAAALRAQGHNPQQTLHVTAIDVDSTAAHMCFVQLSLLHIPAVVYVGNTLTLEMREAFYTPAHYLGLWNWKLRRSQETTCPDQ